MWLLRMRAPFLAKYARGCISETMYMTSIFNWRALALRFSEGTHDFSLPTRLQLFAINGFP